METSKCRGCGRKILWATGPNGKPIPLDAVAPVYAVKPGLSALDGPTAERLPDAYVTHFATCSKANEFSAGKKPPAGGA
jgi:hypothetical protein